MSGITSLNLKISRGGRYRIIFSHSSSGSEGGCREWATMFGLLNESEDRLFPTSRT